MRNVLLFGSGYFGDHLFQDENGGHFIDVPSDRSSDVGESERHFTVTGCVLDGMLCYIGVNGDLPTANDVQTAVEKMRQRHPVKNSRRIERLNQVNFRDAPMQSYTALHATEEVDVFVFGEGWDGQTVYVEPYICLYLPCRDGSRHLKSFELHYHQRFGIGYLLAVRGNHPAEDEINAIIDKRNLKHSRSKY